MEEDIVGMLVGRCLELTWPRSLCASGRERLWPMVSSAGEKDELARIAIHSHQVACQTRQLIVLDLLDNGSVL